MQNFFIGSHQKVRVKRNTRNSTLPGQYKTERAEAVHPCQASLEAYQSEVSRSIVHEFIPHHTSTSQKKLKSVTHRIYNSSQHAIPSNPVQAADKTSFPNLMSPQASKADVQLLPAHHAESRNGLALQKNLQHMFNQTQQHPDLSWVTFSPQPKAGVTASNFIKVDGSLHLTTPQLPTTKFKSFYKNFDLLPAVNNRDEVEHGIKKERYTNPRIPQRSTKKRQFYDGAQISYLLRHQQDVWRGGMNHGHTNTSFITSYRNHLKLNANTNSVSKAGHSP